METSGLFFCLVHWHNPISNQGAGFSVADELTVREMFFEIRGKLDVIATEHAHTRESVTEVKTKQHSLANEVMILQKEAAHLSGERKGFMMGARALVFLSSVSGLGGLAVVAKTIAGH